MIEIIDRVSQRVKKLAASSVAQAAHLSEVNTSLSDHERNTQQNAAMSEELSAASELLQLSVADLTERTAVFVRTPVSHDSEERYLSFG